MLKLKWKVDPPPEGRYRSFEHRGWPTAEYADGSIAARVTCADEYRPRNVREGKHAPLVVWVADYTVKPVWKWRKLVGTFATLDAAKQRVVEVLTQFPEVRGGH